VVAAAVALVTGSSPAAAREAYDLPAYSPGDAFVYSDGRVEQVQAVDGDVIAWVGLQGEPYRRPRNFVLPVLGWRFNQGEGRRSVSGHPETLWPLTPGASARFSVITEFRRDPKAAWERNLALWTCKTGPRHEIEVPAGRFPVLSIACDRFSSWNMRLQERVTSDYAPDVGHYIRRTSIDYLAARTTTIALTGELHGPAATRARLMALSAEATRHGAASTASLSKKN
jgi:hypothetical protein